MTAPSISPEYGDFIYVHHVVGNPYGNSGATTGVEYTVDIENLIAGGYMTIAPGSVSDPYTVPLGSYGTDPLNPAPGEWVYVYNNVGTPYGNAGTVVGVEYTTHIHRLVEDGSMALTLPPTSQYENFPLYGDNSFASLGMVKDLMYAYYGGYDGGDGDYSHLVLSQRLRDAIVEEMGIAYDPTVQALLDDAEAYNASTLAARDLTLTYRNTASTHATTATTQAGIATTKAGEAATSAANALAYRNTASTHATTATTQAGIATTQAGIAEDEADAAAASAANALSYRNTASTHATTATTQAGIATAQAGIATTKAGEAATSASNAAGSESTVAASAAAAASSASDALSYRNTALTHATTASTQAGIATTQAGIATSEAGDAADSAADALSYRNTALTYATTATTQAGIATTKAGEASTSAANALSYRNTANTAASAAEAARDVALANSLTWRGTWSAGTSYIARDAVSYNGSSWRALAPSTGVTPVEGASWTILAAKGDAGGSAWGDLTGKPSTFPPDAHTHSVSDMTATGRTTSNFLRGDNTWATPTDTTYAVMAQAEATTGTATTARTVSAAGLKGTVQRWATGSYTTAITPTGQSLASAADATAARAAIGAGTSSLTLGTTAGTAKAGDYAPAWGDVTSKPATFPPTIGTTSTTAKAGNYVPSWSEVTSKPATYPPVIGSGAADAVAGNDPRLTDARTPTTHTHPVTDMTATGTRSSSTYLRGDNTWATPTNTTYAVPTQAEAEAGTATTGRAFSAQRVRQAADAAITAREWVGTQAQYDAIGTKNPNITYYIVD